MAKENIVFLHGQIYSKPDIEFNDDGTPRRGGFVLKTVRRPTNSNQILAANLSIDCPIIYTRNAEILDYIAGSVAEKRDPLTQFDMVDIKGTLCTKEKIKRSICPNCQAENRTRGNSVFINPIYICKREEGRIETDSGQLMRPGIDSVEGLALLKERAEISNLVMLIGELCVEPEFYEDVNGKPYAQYQIAVNRKYRILEDPPEKKTDYPWVKTFSTQALEDAKSLHLHSGVYISGALQTRTDIKRRTVCEECGQLYEWTEPSILEVVPYFTDYLWNCNVPKKEDQEKSEQEIVL